MRKSEVELTPEILIDLGFYENEEVASIERSFYSKQIDFDRYLRVYLNPEYDISNPNRSYITIFNDMAIAGGVPKSLAYKRDWTKKEMERVGNFKVWLAPTEQRIASHVNTLDRLEAIYFGLTGTRNFHKKLRFETSAIGDDEMEEIILHDFLDWLDEKFGILNILTANSESLIKEYLEEN
jgi:hypothetical protein